MQSVACLDIVSLWVYSCTKTYGPDRTGGRRESVAHTTSVGCLSGLPAPLHAHEALSLFGCSVLLFARGAERSCTYRTLHIHNIGSSLGCPVASCLFIYAATFFFFLSFLPFFLSLFFNDDMPVLHASAYRM